MTGARRVKGERLRRIFNFDNCRAEGIIIIYNIRE